MTHPFSFSAPLQLSSSALEACVALDQRCLNGFWSSAQWRRELSEPGRLCLGSWADATQHDLVGLSSGWLVAGELQLMLLLVDPRWRRQGLGTVLLQALISAAAQQGCQGVSLEVAAGNEAARGLYKKLGFTTSAKRRGYYRNGDDALLQYLGMSDCKNRTDNRPD
ncbi:MAG: GNAT family N-acetyltransferase [Synechococcus sp.]|nr:GNAT family N-acetyltransferase [Synechococcus sp.]